MFLKMCSFLWIGGNLLYLGLLVPRLVLILMWIMPKLDFFFVYCIDGARAGKFLSLALFSIGHWAPLYTSCILGGMIPFWLCFYLNEFPLLTYQNKINTNTLILIIK